MKFKYLSKKRCKIKLRKSKINESSTFQKNKSNAEFNFQENNIL